MFEHSWRLMSQETEFSFTFYYRHDREHQTNYGANIRSKMHSPHGDKSGAQVLAKAGS